MNTTVIDSTHGVVTVTMPDSPERAALVATIATGKFTVTGRGNGSIETAVAQIWDSIGRPDKAREARGTHAQDGHRFDYVPKTPTNIAAESGGSSPIRLADLVALSRALGNMRSVAILQSGHALRAEYTGGRFDGRDGNGVHLADDGQTVLDLHGHTLTPRTLTCADVATLSRKLPEWTPWSTGSVPPVADDAPEVMPVPENHPNQTMLDLEGKSTVFQSVGESVSVKGVSYTVTDVNVARGLGSKFDGKAIYTVEDASGARWTAYGKRVAGNSRLTPVDVDPNVAPDGKPFRIGDEWVTEAEYAAHLHTSGRMSDADYADFTRVTPVERCDHVTGEPGCDQPFTTCQGIPAASVADRNRQATRPVANVSECGTETLGRAFTLALRGALRHEGVTLAEYADADESNRRNTRRVQVWTMTVSGDSEHAVTVVGYESRSGRSDPASFAAVYVDDRLITGAVRLSQAPERLGAEIAHVVALDLGAVDRWGLPVARTPVAVPVPVPVPVDVDVPARDAACFAIAEDAARDVHAGRFAEARAKVADGEAIDPDYRAHPHVTWARMRAVIDSHEAKAVALPVAPVVAPVVDVADVATLPAIPDTGTDGSDAVSTTVADTIETDSPDAGAPVAARNPSAAIQRYIDREAADVATLAREAADAAALADAARASLVAFTASLPSGAPVSVPVDVPAGHLAFVFAPFVAGGPSYRALRNVLRVALRNAGLPADVVKSNVGRRGFTVGYGTSDPDQVSTVVRESVAVVEPATV